MLLTSILSYTQAWRWQNNALFQPLASLGPAQYIYIYSRTRSTIIKKWKKREKTIYILTQRSSGNQNFWHKWLSFESVDSICLNHSNKQFLLENKLLFSRTAKVPCIFPMKKATAQYLSSVTPSFHPSFQIFVTARAKSIWATTM